MAKSDPFKAQHKELLDLAGKLKPMIASPDTVKAKVADIRVALTALTGKINIHLGMEDNTLYKAMLANPKSKATAERFQQEMGGIKTAFVAYVGKWGTPAAITGNPAGFIAETNGILTALGGRIQKEEKDLYALYDTL